MHRRVEQVEQNPGSAPPHALERMKASRSQLLQLKLAFEAQICDPGACAEGEPKSQTLL